MPDLKWRLTVLETAVETASQGLATELDTRLLTPARPSFGTVDHSCPRKCRPNLRGTHSSSKTRISAAVDKFVCVNQPRAGSRNRLGRLLSIHRREIV